jgi:hypothetical protein
MSPKFYDSELLIAMITRHCNNPDDLGKIMSACECLRENLEVSENIQPPTLVVHQLLAKADAEKCGK